MRRTTSQVTDVRAISERHRRGQSLSVTILVYGKSTRTDDPCVLIGHCACMKAMIALAQHRDRCCVRHLTVPVWMEPSEDDTTTTPGLQQKAPPINGQSARDHSGVKLTSDVSISPPSLAVTVCPRYCRHEEVRGRKRCLMRGVPGTAQN